MGVSSYGAGTVAIVRAESVAAVVPSATAGPRAALVCRDKLYVAEERLGAVSVLALPGFEPLARVPVGAKPRALCRGPNSARIYVACFGDSSVYAIDAVADTVTGHIVSGNAPYEQTISSEIIKTQDFLYKLTGRQARLFRLLAGLYECARKG